MTSPSSYHLPGNGFSVWTQHAPASLAVQLVSSSTTEGAPEAPSATSSENDSSTFATYPETSSESSRSDGGFLKWAALFLFLCALAAFLSSESKRKEVVAERNQLQDDKASLTIEKQTYHDHWVTEQQTTARLTDEIGDLEESLAASKSNVVQLTAEKNGLSQTINELRGSLAMAIEDHKNTEASLQKVIKGLESKNAELTSVLQEERVKLQGLDERLSQVMKELGEAKETNQKLTEENTGLRDKVAQLQSTLDQAVQEAEARESSLRQEIADLRETNTALSASLETQKQDLQQVRTQLKASEEALASERQRHEEAQNLVNDLASQLEDVAAKSEAIEAEKQALAESVQQLSDRLNAGEGAHLADAALKEKIDQLTATNIQSQEHITSLENTRDDLLARNSQLQSSVEELNGHLSKLAEEEEAEEGALNQRIDQLTKTNQELKASLESQRAEFNTLIRQGGDGATQVTKPSASLDTDTEALQGAVRDLKNTLGQALERESASQQDLSTQIATHTEEMLDLNTRMAVTNNELASARALLSELDGLREEVHSLRSQGEELESELAQRATHISTLSRENASWKEETDKLRHLLETEQVAQNKLRDFVDALQTRIDLLESTPQAVAEK
jgi:chromosome segregation ATPase